MRIRHLVAASNVDAEGWIIDALAVRHGVIVGGMIDALAGPIDPLTHLNLDFADHALEDCLVAERLEVGAPVLWQGEQFRRAYTPHSAYARRGAVNQHKRRADWQANVELRIEH